MFDADDFIIYNLYIKIFEVYRLLRKKQKEYLIKWAINKEWRIITLNFVGMRKRWQLLVFSLAAILAVGMMPQYVQASSVTSYGNSAQHLNLVKRYLYLGDKGRDTFDFSINRDVEKEGAKYYWYVKSDKGNPDSVIIDKNTGIVTAKEAGTAYIRCRITYTDGSIIRPEARVTVRNNITAVAISNIPDDNIINIGTVMDFNRTILNTSAGKEAKTQGITRWEIANDTADVGTVTEKGEVLPTKEGSFQIRAVCFQSSEKYKLWLSDKGKYKKYLTAASKWSAITVKASDQSGTAATQGQLESLLLDKSINQITISTDQEIKFTIPEGNYSNISLIVNAANSDVNNYGIFKTIIVNAIKDHTWIEFADGNIIHLNDDVASIVIDENVKVKQIVIDKADSQISIQINGTVEQINVLQSSQLNIQGSSKEVPVLVADSAAGSSIQSSVPLSLTLNADTEIKLEKGAEDTVLNKSASDVNILVDNNTDANVILTTDKTDEKIIPPKSSNTNQNGSVPEAPKIAINSIGNIIGTPKIGVELKAGVLSPVGASVSYQWMKSNSKNGTYSNIEGATGDSYTPVESDESKYIKVKVTGTGSYIGGFTSSATEAVAKSDQKLQEEAEDAVTAYEGAPITTLSEVTAAENLKSGAETAVLLVADVTIKAALDLRITDREAAVSEAKKELEADKAVEEYETAPNATLSEVILAEGLKLPAETAVASVGDASVKAALLQRITDRAVVIAAARTQLEAEAQLESDAETAVSAYETAPLTNLTEVAHAEGLKSAADLAAAAVQNTTAKSSFEQRITNQAAKIMEARAEMEAEARAELEADAAVVTYETAPITTLAEITSANGLKITAESAVAKVGDATTKNSLQQRIISREAAVSEAKKELEAETAVEAYETAPAATLSEVALAEGLRSPAETAVAAVGNTSIRSALSQRITDRAAVIAAARTQLEAEAQLESDAEAAVNVYETAPLTNLTEVVHAEGLKSAADLAAAAVQNTTVKNSFEQRITNQAVKIMEARAEFEAEQSISNYEAAPIATLSEVAAAEGMKTTVDAKISAVSNVAIKASFEQRVMDRAAVIAEARAELEAHVAVETYETAPITTLSEITMAEGLEITAETAVAAVSNTTMKNALLQRITDHKAIVTEEKAKLKAEAAVIKAESTDLQADLTSAQLLVTALPDGTFKTDLQNRMNAVQAIVDAGQAVSEAEASTIQTELDAAQNLVSALPDGTAKTALQSRINSVQSIINDRIAQANNAISVSNVKTLVEGSAFGMNQSGVSSEADILSEIQSIIGGLSLDGVTANVTKILYTPAVAGTESDTDGTNGAYTFQVSLSKGAAATLATGNTATLTMSITASVYIPPQIITSIAITNFNFATINSSTASLVSKPISSSDFSGSNAKQFTITDGEGNVVNINLYWNITSDQGFSAAALVGSGIESYIQQYFVDKGGAAALMNRTLWCASFSGNTFTLSTFYEGLLNKITIGGPDGSYFFNTLSAQGTDLDTSANKSFSISDGTNTANITFNTDLTSMDSIISKINTRLTARSVQAVAVKIDESHFKIVGNGITISGADKAVFFSSFVSQ